MRDTQREEVLFIKGNLSIRVQVLLKIKTDAKIKITSRTITFLLTMINKKILSIKMFLCHGFCNIFIHAPGRNRTCEPKGPGFLEYFLKFSRPVQYHYATEACYKEIIFGFKLFVSRLYQFKISFKII
jgi:hypothetical protein